MAGVLYWVLILAGNPRHFLSESITTALVCNASCWRIYTGRALGLCPNIFSVMDSKNYWQR